MHPHDSELPLLTAVPLIDESRVFLLEELFFSTTDDKGRIRTANEVFFRVSAFSAAEMIGKPHNIIRHPDMPRVIFRLLWDVIKAGESILAYVKNRAKDARYYWVCALVTPIEGGFLSVRFKPSSALFAPVQDLYRELRQIEAAVEKAGGGKPAAIAAGQEALDARLRLLGFADYKAFMYAAFEREFQSRETLLGKRRRSEIGEGPEQADDGDAAQQLARTIATSCQEALTALNRLFQELATYSELNDRITLKSEFVASLSESIRRLSLNGAIETETLGEQASGLGKVMDWLQQYSNEIAGGCKDVTSLLTRLISRIKFLIFELDAAKLQLEMTTQFAMEVVHQGAGDAEGAGSDSRMRCRSVRQLYRSSRQTVDHALTTLATVANDLHPIENAQARLWRSIRSLRLIYLRGKVELASAGNGHLIIIFDDMHQHVADAEANLSALEQLIRRVEDELLRSVELSGPIQSAIGKINQWNTSVGEEDDRGPELS